MKNRHILSQREKIRIENALAHLPRTAQVRNLIQKGRKPTMKPPKKKDHSLSIYSSDDEMRALLSKNRPKPDIAEVQSERANDTQKEASFLQTPAHSLDDSEEISEAIDGELAEIAK